MDPGVRPLWLNSGARKRQNHKGRAIPVPIKGRRRSGALRLLFFMSLVGMGGCHSSWPLDRSAPVLENAQFMDAWGTYLHCRSSVEPGAINADLQKLDRAAQVVVARNTPFLPLPAGLKVHVAAPPSRLAVDPHALVAACAQHGDKVAQAAGQSEAMAELVTARLTSQEGKPSARHGTEPGRTFQPSE